MIVKKATGIYEERKGEREKRQSDEEDGWGGVVITIIWGDKRKNEGRRFL